MTTSRASDPHADRSRFADVSDSTVLAEGSAYWLRTLAGEDRNLERLRSWLGMLPDAPRCKICRAPFAAWGSLISRGIGRRRASGDVMLCRGCSARVTQHQGTAEVDATIIIADNRASESLHTDGDKTHFTRLVGRAIDRHGGILEKVEDNHLRAFFIAWSAGEDHVRRAIDACRDLFAAASDDRDGRRSIGVGLHTGRARIGTMSDGDRVDFGATGPIVNVTAKLASAATAGEALVSLAAWRQQGGPVAKSRRRSVPIPGELQPIEAVVVRGDIEAKL